MRIDDMLSEQRAIVLEYGRSGFPGFGRHLFSQRFYEYMVPRINQISDTQAREWLTHWLAELFSQDNGKFSVDRFTKAVQAQKNYGASPTFEQRHFFYLAHWVKQIEDPHIHDFVENWLAETAGRTNPQFKPSVWAKYCASDKPRAPAAPAGGTTPPSRQKPPGEAPEAPAQEVDEGPAYGHRGHGGFGQKIFTRGHYLSVAWFLHFVNDPVVREHMTHWFEEMFKLDNPAFKPDGFEQAVMSAPSYHSGRPNPRWQQRHFYFMAHEVADIADAHERKFVADWLADHIGYTNEYFNRERWDQYCNLSDKHYERRAVQHNRAKARGDSDVPAHPWASHDAANQDMMVDEDDYRRSPGKLLPPNGGMNPADGQRKGDQEMAELVRRQAAMPRPQQTGQRPASFLSKTTWQGYDISKIDPTLRASLARYDKAEQVLKAHKAKLVAQLTGHGTAPNETQPSGAWVT